MMGLDENEADPFEGDIGQMELDLLNENVDGEEKQIDIRMFIDLDEDNENKYNINVNEVFERQDTSMQFYIDVSTRVLRHSPLYFSLKSATTIT